MTGAATKKTGRPRKKDDFKFYDGDLHKLLVKKLPAKFVRAGRIDTLLLAEATKYVRFTIYRLLNEQSLSPGAFRALLELSEKADGAKKGALTKEDLLPFLCK